MLYVLIFLSLLSSMSVQANTYHEEALKLSIDAEEKKLLYLKEAKELHNNITKGLQETLQHNTLEQKSAPCQTNIPKQKNNNKEYLVFVSLSMPANTLKALYQEAESDGAILILRGLKDESFKKTGEHIKELGIGLQIDPELFKKYQIQKVPTFIWINKNEHHSLSGNVSFKFAKQKFQEANL